MKIKISALLIIIAFSFSFSSCEKDDDVTPQNVKALLTAKTWSFNNITHDDPAYAIGIALLEVFMENATYTYKEDGTYSGTILGLPVTGTWSLSEDEKTLTVDDDTYTITISSSSLTWKDADGYIYNWK